MSKSNPTSAKRPANPARIGSSPYHLNCFSKAIEKGQGELTLDQNVVHQDAIWKTQVRFEADLSRKWQDNYGYMKGDEARPSSATMDQDPAVTGHVSQFPAATSREIGWVSRPDRINKIETSEFHGRQKSGLSYV
eukprot:Opistho-2@15181